MLPSTLTAISDHFVVRFACGIGHFAILLARAVTVEVEKTRQKALETPSDSHRHSDCDLSLLDNIPPRNGNMDLTIEIPAMVALGLATMGLLFVFVIACDKV